MARRTTIGQLSALVVFLVLAGAGYLNRDVPAGVGDRSSRREPASQSPDSKTSRTSRAPDARTADVDSIQLSAITNREERDAVQRTLQLIATKGPFPHRKDGTTFRNLESRLPRKPSGYYREYTVETRGARTRGARRLVAGKDGEMYYTRDHYGSFLKIR